MLGMQRRDIIEGPTDIKKNHKLLQTIFISKIENLEKVYRFLEKQNWHKK